MPGLNKGQRNLGLAVQRELLLSQLRSDQHYSATPTVAYGAHDPFDVSLAVCDSCSIKPRLERVTNQRSKQRWQVNCQGCMKVSGEPVRNAWTASLMWNGLNLKSQQYPDLPLFGLNGLCPRQAHDRIRLIRENLVIRIQLCGVERQLFASGYETRKPGINYSLRLDAYLKWAMLAHRLIRKAKIDLSAYFGS